MTEYALKLKEFNKSDYWIRDMLHLYAEVRALSAGLIVDYGCGLGVPRCIVDDLFDRTIRVDPNVESYAGEADKRRIPLHSRSVRLLPRETLSQIDSVVLSHVYHHLSDHDLKVFFEDLKTYVPNTKFIFVISPNWLFSYARLLRGRVYALWSDKTVRSHALPKAICRVFADHGYTTEKLEFIGDHPLWFRTPDFMRARVFAVFSNSAM